MAGAHINYNELYALVLAVRMRLRSGSLGRLTFMHMLDSQVVLAVASRARSSSRLLQPLLLAMCAGVIAADAYPLFGFFSSADNPSDIPSRWAAMSLRASARLSDSRGRG